MFIRESCNVGCSTIRNAAIAALDRMQLRLQGRPDPVLPNRRRPDRDLSAGKVSSMPRIGRTGTDLEPRNCPGDGVSRRIPGVAEL